MTIQWKSEGFGREQIIWKADWSEDEHPRDEYGRFEGSGESITRSAEEHAASYAATQEAVEKGLKSVSSRAIAGKCKSEVVTDVTNRMGTKWDDKLISSSDLARMRPNDVWVKQPDGSYKYNLTALNDAQRDRYLKEKGAVKGDDPNLRTTLREEGVSRLVSMWAGSSNDQSAISLTLQRAAEKEFGIKGAMKWPMDQRVKETVDKFTKERGGMYQAFLRAQYESTQDFFKSAGITEISVSRGMAVESTSKIVGQTEAQLPLRPLSSFTYSDSVALRFAREEARTHPGTSQVVIEGSVPVDRVLSCARTGIGCLNEREIVVLGGPGTWTVKGKTK